MDARWRDFQLARLLDKIDNTKANSKGCHFWNDNLCCNQKPGGPKYGRLKVTLPNGQKNVLLAHRFVYMLHYNMPHLPADLHVSHKCHESLCINALHLSLEPKHVNTSRNSCRGTRPLHCLKHEGYADCILE